MSSINRSKPFQFHQPHLKIDWDAIRSLDVQHIIRHNDLDTLELYLDTLALGSIGASDSSSEINNSNLLRLVSAAQLALQYLLHVQDYLASCTHRLKSELKTTKESNKDLADQLIKRDESHSAASRENRRLKQEIDRLEDALVAARRIPATAIVPEVKIVEKEVMHPEMTRALDELALQRRQAQEEVALLKQALADTVAQLQVIQHSVQEKKVGETSEPLPVSEESDETSQLKLQLNKALRQSRQLQRQKDSLQIELVKLLREKERKSKLSFESPTPSSTSTTSQQQSVWTPPSDTTAATSPCCSDGQIDAAVVVETTPRNDDTSPANKTTTTEEGKTSAASAASPTPSQRQRFLKELPHRHPLRPEIISKFPHSPTHVATIRKELNQELQAEVAAGLASLGIGPRHATHGLTDQETAQCLAELQRRREEAYAAMNDTDKSRAEFMRRTVTWHLNNVLGTKQHSVDVEVATPPKNLPRIRTAINTSTSDSNEQPAQYSTSKTPPALPSPNKKWQQQQMDNVELLRQELVNNALTDTHNADFYSPLRQGNANSSTPYSSVHSQAL